MRPDLLDNELTLWRCPDCPVLIPAVGRIPTVDEHEQQHEEAQ